MSLMPRIERQENKVEMVVQFTTELMKIYSLAQATVYMIHPTFRRIYSTGVAKDQQSCVFKVPFRDEIAINYLPVYGVCKEKQRCGEMVFKDFDVPYAQGLIPRNQDEALIVSHQEHKIGILSMNREDEPVCLL